MLMIPSSGIDIADDLIHAKGFTVGENRVARLCPLQGISSTIIKHRGPGKNAEPAVHDDRVMRDFTAQAPNVKWLVDFLEHWTGESKIYLCAIKDCASKRIVGYAIDSRMTSEMAVNALRMAIMLRGRPAGTIVHSDRGGQFRSKKLAMTLRNNALVGSMGRVASAGHNAAMESFLMLLQKKRPQPQAVATRKELRLAIITWIERTSHSRRRQRSMGKLTPIEFEILHSQVALAA